MLPYWLCPTQLRIVPVSEKYVEKCLNLARYFNSSGIRTDVDDRSETIQKKVLQSEKEWIKYLIVYGEKEIKERVYSVRDRETGEIKEFTEDELKRKLFEEQKGMPWRPLPVNIRLSKRPIFYG